MPKKIKQFLKKIKPKHIIIPLLVGGIITAIILRPEEPRSRYTVDTGTVERSVVATGRIEQSNEVDLGFQQSGVVSRVTIKSGQRVSAGQLLAQLDLGTLSAELAEARANLDAARLEKATSELDTNQQKNTLIKDTERAEKNLQTLQLKLLSSDIQMYPETSLSSDVEWPVVSGNWNDLVDSAQYKISIYASQSASGYSMNYSGYETGTVELSTYYPVPLGTHGLYVQMPEQTGSGLLNTKWVIDIPNKRSSQYASNLSQYLEAKKTYEESLSKQSDSVNLLQASYNGKTSEDIAIAKAQAAVARVEQSIRLRGIYAPVSGTIGQVSIRKGESVASGESHITLLGGQSFITKLKVSETAIGGVENGDPVRLSVDALPGRDFEGVVTEINSSETYVDGTPVYETTVIIEDPKKELRSGMHATGRIILDSIPDTVRVPDTALIKNDDGYQVEKFISSDTNETIMVPVTLGIMGSDGVYAVTAGLSAGDQISIDSQQ